MESIAALIDNTKQQFHPSNLHMCRGDSNESEDVRRGAISGRTQLPTICTRKFPKLANRNRNRNRNRNQRRVVAKRRSKAHSILTQTKHGQEALRRLNNCQTQ